jgi:hypothetical protein
LTRTSWVCRCVSRSGQKRIEKPRNGHSRAPEWPRNLVLTDDSYG